jgi:hypothetical protein
MKQISNTVKIKNIGKINLLFLFLLLFSTNALSQDISKGKKKPVVNPSPFIMADTTVVLRRGIYKNFDEFKYNQPSELAKFSVYPKERNYNFGKKYTHYQIRLDGKTDKDVFPIPDTGSVEYYTPYWGFSDGEYVYKMGKSQMLGKDNYDRLEPSGRYIVYNEFRFAQGGNATMQGHGNKVVTLVLDINTGRTYYLSVRCVKKLIASDTELLKRYEEVENKKEMMFFILKQFNERNKVKLN